MILLFALAAAASAEPAPNGTGHHSASTSVDYPAEAFRRREQGRVAFEITISPEGRVSACRVTRSSGSASLDQATCEIMQRGAMFRPARDSHGNAVASTVRSAINWILPH